MVPLCVLDEEPVDIDTIVGPLVNARGINGSEHLELKVKQVYGAGVLPSIGLQDTRDETMWEEES